MAETPIRCVGLVTGRGGSKRIPGKNVRPLAGRPLVAWAVEAACQASSIGRVLISTDDAAIANAALEAGGEVPFMRPAHLSGDHASHVGVIAHALDWLEAECGLPEFICLLQPTSPLRQAEDIDALVELVRRTGADCGITVSPVRHHPAHMFVVSEAGAARPFVSVASGYQRSQDLPPLHVVNGAVYVLRPETFRTRDSVLSDNLVAHVMPEMRSIDIDTDHDFQLAETILAAGLPADAETRPASGQADF